MEKSIQRLEGFLKTLNDGLTKEEFLSAFEQVVKIVVATQTKLFGDSNLLRDDFEQFRTELLKSQTTDLQAIKDSAKAAIAAAVSNMLSDYNKRMVAVENRIGALVDGKDADEEAMLAKLNAMIPTVDAILQYLPQAGVPIRDALELLQGKERLNWTAIDGLEEKIRQEISDALKAGKSVTYSGATRGFFVYINGVKKGIMQTIDFVEGTNMNVEYSKVNGRDTITFSSSGGGGGAWMAPETPDGDIDGSNVTYTISYVPATLSGFLFLDGRYFVEGIDWTIVDNILTMSTPLDATFATVPFIFKGQYASGLPVTPPDENALLIEDNSEFILEDGTALLLE